MNEHFELPDNWEVVTLEDVAEGKNAIVDGPFGSNLKTSDYIDDNINGVPVLTTKNLEGDYSDRNVRFISKEKFEELKRSQVKPGDILVAKIGSIGKTGIYPKNARVAIIPANLLKFTVSKKVEFNYVFYYINSRGLQNRIKKISTATAQPAFNVTKFRKLLIPLPPKPTQQLIVSKIEELFSELDKGIENLRIAQQQLKIYRQAVLKFAFVNESLNNVLLVDITEKIQIGPFGTQLHKEDYIENGIPLINPTHIKNGFIVADNSFSILKSKRNSLPNYILKEGDIIMGRRGEMGRCGLVTKKEDGWFCGTGSLYFRPNNKKVNSIFLYHYLKSESVKKYLDDNAGGTTMANLNLKIVKNIPIPLPSIEVQNTIVQSIESRLSVADKMEESINQSLQQAEALRQSILKKAFEGNL